jgi:fatty-acyl-CoA synthase
MSEHSTLAGRIDDWSERWGTNVAVAWESSAWTFADLARESRRRAVALQALGVGPGTHVGLLQSNRPEWLACAFGVWRMGAILVPLNTLYRAEELHYALNHADVEVLIADYSFLGHDYYGHLAGMCPRLFEASGGSGESSLRRLRRALFAGAPDIPAEQSWDLQVAGTAEWRENFRRWPGDDAAIFFTSGSTALPKAAVHTHAGMLRAAENVAERLGFDSEDRTYGYLPMFFNGGLVGVALSTLTRGGAVLLQDVFSAEDAIALMARHNCSVFFGWPHQADAIARHPTFDRSCIALRKGPGANAPWAAALLSEDHRCVGTWGMTETGPMAACSHHSDPLETRRSSHGRAMPGLEIRIVDSQSRPLPPDTAGEIVVRGDSLMRTYYRCEPAACFDPGGFFHTGDEGRMDRHGNLTFVGRLLDIIKTAGVSVAAAEIEEVLKTHPQIDGAYAVPVPHPTRGENVAAFILSSAEHLDLDSVADHCRQKLASYKVPRHFFLIDAPQLPMLGSGKVDRKSLRSRAADLAAADGPR